MEIQQVVGNWTYPTNIRFGVGRIAELAQACQALGFKKTLLVTGTRLAELDLISNQVECLEGAGISVCLFCDVQSLISEESIKQGVNAFRIAEADSIVAIGGGSVLDMAKAIALMASGAEDIWAFSCRGARASAALNINIPIIAVPTTAGTGSAVNTRALIANPSSHQRQYVFHPQMLPSLVIADPALCVQLPAHLTAATGMHALTNNLESYYAADFNPFFDGVNLEGIRLVKENLVLACQDPTNYHARANMLAASLMGGIEHARGMGALHILAQVLGMEYGLHHGLLKGILLPYVLAFNRPVIEAKVAHLAHYLNLVTPLFSSVFEWSLSFRNELNIPHTLQPLGIGIDCADKVAEIASQNADIENNPIPLDAASIKKIYLNAVLGEI